jgi:hypothetical protein
MIANDNMYGHFGDGTPITNDSATEFTRVVNASSWIDMLAAPKLWAILRRVPPKAFLLEQVERYLAYAKSRRHYAYIPEGQARPDLSMRGPAMERLRDLVLEWEPPIVTPEIRDAARAVYFTEYGAPPKESWDKAEYDTPGIALEATLIWPEGPWDEAAFLAGNMNNERKPHD